MRDYYFFDIPVYRCPEERFDRERDEALAKRLAEIKDMGVPREKAPESYDMNEQHFQKEYGGPWRYNQTIGWLRLYAEGSHIGGHLWMVDAKRIQRNMRNKRFYLRTGSNVLVANFMPDADAKVIYQETKSAIERLSRESPLKGRYVDLETFCNLGPFIGWRSLLDRTLST